MFQEKAHQTAEHKEKEKNSYKQTWNTSPTRSTQLLAGGPAQP